MTKEKQAAIAAVEAKAAVVADVADSVWGYAELSLQEERSADKYCEALEKEGFTVERGICNISTAFSSTAAIAACFSFVITILPSDRKGHARKCVPLKD